LSSETTPPHHTTTHLNHHFITPPSTTPLTHHCIASPQQASQAVAAQAEPSLGFLAQYRELKAMTRSVQNQLGEVASMVESAKNICTWAQPQITVFLLYACLAALLIVMLIPSWLPITAGMVV
jgi:hypothetical protein